MGKYPIEPDAETVRMLELRAAEEGISPGLLAARLLHMILVPPHNMDRESMKRGFAEVSELELEWAELGFKE